MVVTADFELPTEEELTVPEVNISSSALKAGAFHLGKFCENQNDEFMLCRDELEDPRKCIKEGKDVTACTLDFFRAVKKSCADEFVQYAKCLDKSSGFFDFSVCRKTQAVFDKCMLDNLGVKRPDYGYYCRPKVHQTSRPKPSPPEPTVWPDQPDKLPEDYPKPPAKYGSRFYWLY